MTVHGIHISEISSKIEHINKGILDCIEKYLQGKPFLANKIFNECLDNINIGKIQFERIINPKRIFYRARKKEEQHFNKGDLFHIPFEKRVFVSTNRYSIPGSPALYLAENSYTCWEEFERPDFKNLYFSCFENSHRINIIEILRIEDFIKEIENRSSFKGFYMLKYLLYFPISIACTLKVYNKKGNFKPEYIIPQMLLEYVIQNEIIDGIKFPSTKINHENLKNIQAYNYVFPS
ncbi:hypothetical protein PJW08_01000 [Tenacibaculum finnmarkense]|nr:hypothetical protein PJW08_01000 [Tenacibaculum finnmarkense]